MSTCPLSRFLTTDHERLDALLTRADADPSALDRAAFDEFRAGLLRHIAMEEKILLPEAERRRGGDPLPVADRLTAEHCALAILLVATPTHAIVAEIRRRLVAHNPLEEGETGMYADVARLLSPEEADALVRKLRDFPQPPVAAYSDNPRVLAKIAALMGR